MATPSQKSYSSGQIALTSILAVGALLGMVAAPVIYVNKIASANERQDVQIANVVKQQEITEEHYQQLSSKIDALLLRSGLDPAKVAQNKSIMP